MSILNWEDFKKKKIKKFFGLRTSIRMFFIKNRHLRRLEMKHFDF